MASPGLCSMQTRAERDRELSGTENDNRLPSSGCTPFGGEPFQWGVERVERLHQSSSVSDARFARR